MDAVYSIGSCGRSTRSRLIIGFFFAVLQINLSATAKPIATPTTVAFADAQVDGVHTNLPEVYGTTFATVATPLLSINGATAQVTTTATSTVLDYGVNGLGGDMITTQKGTATGFRDDKGIFHAGSFFGLASSSVDISAGGDVFKAYVFWAMPSDFNGRLYVSNDYAIDSPNVSHAEGGSVQTAYEFDIRITLDSNYVGFVNQAASIYWNLTDWPGKTQSTKINLPQGSTSSSYRISFPAGEQDIGTVGYLYTHTAIEVPGLPAGQDMALDFHVTGPLFSHFLVPAAAGSGDTQFLVQFGQYTFPVIVGQDFNFLDYAMGGVAEFKLLGLGSGSFGQPGNPLDFDSAFKFTGSGVAEVSVGRVVPGDYNGDGVVDAADYTIYRDTLGSTTNLAADGNGNGSIDAGDYDVWKTNFGQTLGSGAGAGANAAVPEPSTVLLAACGLVAVVLPLVRRRHRPINWKYVRFGNERGSAVLRGLFAFAATSRSRIIGPSSRACERKRSLPVMALHLTCFNRARPTAAVPTPPGGGNSPLLGEHPMAERQA